MRPPSQRRIATMLGLSRTTVKDHLRIALDAIAKEAA
jgi:predicted DNA binding protein